MPQIAQIAETYASQIFWLLITFGLIFFLIGRGMVPKIEATVQSRDSRIAADLRAAEQARAEADATEEAYRARLADVRAESGRVIQAAKDSGARATAARVAEADEGIAARTAEAEARLDEARRAALATAARRAALYAGATGKRVGRIVLISEGDTPAGQPRPMFRERAADAAASTPIVPGEQAVAVTLTVVYELE